MFFNVFSWPRHIKWRSVAVYLAWVWCWNDVNQNFICVIPAQRNQRLRASHSTPWECLKAFVFVCKQICSSFIIDKSTRQHPAEDSHNIILMYCTRGHSCEDDKRKKWNEMKHTLDEIKLRRNISDANETQANVSNICDFLSYREFWKRLSKTVGWSLPRPIT